MKLFYQNIVRDVSDLPEHNIYKIKTKLRSVFEKYQNIKTPYKHQAILDNLSKNKDVVMLKQDKVRGMVILNRSKYIEKCYLFWIAPGLRNYTMIQLLTLKGKFKGHCKNFHQILIHKHVKQVPHLASYTELKNYKLDTNGKVHDLPIRPIISIIGIATYHLAKFLVQLLKTLSESRYTIRNTKEIYKEN